MTLPNSGTFDDQSPGRRDRPLALTMGEPAGIGGEIALMAWREMPDQAAAQPFFVIDDPDRLRTVARCTGISVEVAEISAPGDAKELFSKALPVLPHGIPVDVRPGAPDPANGPAVLNSIERAVDFCLTGEARAVVTAPVHKAVLMEAGFNHSGQTDFLGELAVRHVDKMDEVAPAAVAPRPVMMLACPGLRVVPATVHIALRNVPQELTTENLIAIGKCLIGALRHDFGIPHPRIAVAGLNPHAGEDGQFGDEERKIITPAISALQGEALSVAGPFPADTLFHAEARAAYDAVLCMYHDQALIPLKTIDFYGGVNITIGLPFVRTSPDHGTAFDIAGTGTANPASMIAAIEAAARIADNRARTVRV